MKILFAIGAGSFIGGMARFLLTQLVQSKFITLFPLGTLAVNTLGCFFIGIVFGVADKGNLNGEWKLFLATGILGGFTTFSAFSLETINLFREGQLGFASLYITGSILLGLLATYSGVLIMRIF